MLNTFIGICLTCSTVAAVVTAWAFGAFWLCPVLGVAGGWFTAHLAADVDDEDEAE
jgi:hypothetical protein